MSVGIGDGLRGLVHRAAQLVDSLSIGYYSVIIHKACGECRVSFYELVCRFLKRVGALQPVQHNLFCFKFSSVNRCPIHLSFLCIFIKPRKFRGPIMLWVCRRSSVEVLVFMQSRFFYLTDPSDILTQLRSQEIPMCKKLRFLFVCEPFIFQSILVIFCFFMFFIIFSFCSMPTDFVWLLMFSRDRGGHGRNF